MRSTNKARQVFSNPVTPGAQSKIQNKMDSHPLTRRTRSALDVATTALMNQMQTMAFNRNSNKRCTHMMTITKPQQMKQRRVRLETRRSAVPKLSHPHRQCHCHRLFCLTVGSMLALSVQLRARIDDGTLHGMDPSGNCSCPICLCVCFLACSSTGAHFILAIASFKQCGTTGTHQKAEEPISAGQSHVRHHKWSDGCHN